MKKFVTAITILTFAIALFVAVSLTACDSNSGKIKITSAMFTDYRVDLSGSQGLGIAETDETKTQNKNYMVTLNEDGSLKDVVFLSSSGDETTQEEIEGSIEKLYITEKFTFMMFAKNASAIQGEDYNTTGYYCNNKQQSFAIDNATGKIYSLEQLCGDSYMIIEDGYVRIPNQKSSDDNGGNSFALSILGGNLVFTDLTPNPNLQYSNIVCDKFGNFYVGIFAPNEEIDNILYYDCKQTDSNTKIKYCKGNDGYVYKTDIEGYSRDFNRGSIKRMGENFEEIDLEYDSSIVITYGYNEKIIIEGERLLHAYGTNLTFASYVNGEFIETGRLYLPGYPVFIATELFFVSITSGTYKKLYHYDWLTKTETFILDGVSRLTTENSNLYAYVDSVTGTKKYEITFIDGEAGYTLASEKTYDRTIITIQPLN